MYRIERFGLFFNMTFSVKEQLRKIFRGTSEVISVELLEKKLQRSLETQKPLRIKAGFDPTAPDMHLGHLVLLRKLRQFQDLGHEVYFLIGDFTAQIGDPTGRDQKRSKLDRAQVESHAQTYKDQVLSVLDPHKTQVVFNSSWLDKLSSQHILELTAHSTVAQMLARSDFKTRFDQNKEISILEFIYPLLQGYDSVYLKADVELGGSDQKFNLLMGRQLQEVFKQEPQVVIMTPLLEGLDGLQKMSKSLGNYIGIDEAPTEIFGKTMSINDTLMMKYYEFLTERDLSQVKLLHPKEAKLQLAAEIVRQFYGEGVAQKEKERFEKIFSQRQDPKDMPVFEFGTSAPSLCDILVNATKMITSRREFNRLLEQGAISHNGNKIDAHWPVQEGVIKIGKRQFLRLCLKP